MPIIPYNKPHVGGAQRFVNEARHVVKSHGFHKLHHVAYCAYYVHALVSDAQGLGFIVIGGVLFMHAAVIIVSDE